MNIIEFHNLCRSEQGLDPLINHSILREFAEKAAKWMARRRFNNFWNFDQTKKQLIELDFENIDYNIAIGDSEYIIMKHFFKNIDKNAKIYQDFKYIGYGVFQTEYKHWCILYGR